jgi:hypothetical protein
MFFDFKPSSNNWINKVSNDYMSYKLWEGSMSEKTVSNRSSAYTDGRIAPIDPVDTAFNFVIAIWAVLGIIFAIVIKINTDAWIADLLAVVLPLSPVIFIFVHMKYAPSKKIVEIPHAAVIDSARLQRLPSGYKLDICETASQDGEMIIIATDNQGHPLFFVPEDARDIVLSHYKNDPKFKCKMLPSSPWTAMKVFYS